MSVRIEVLVLAAAAFLSAQNPPHSGIDRVNLDPSCKPCTDFWRYANGGWLDKNPIPQRSARWGTLSVMTEANRERLRAILESAAQNTSAQPGSIERQIGDFYTSCMDTAAIDAKGIQPIQQDLDRISALSSVKELVVAITEFQRTASLQPGERPAMQLFGPVSLSGAPDRKNSKYVIGSVVGGGLSLPDRDYYFKDDPKSRGLREEFSKHISRMFELMGDTPASALSSAGAVLRFETAFAEVTFTNVERRDPYKTYNKVDLAGLSGLTPDYDWKTVLRQFHIAESTPINMGNPKLIEKFNRQLSSVPLDDWKIWLRWRVVSLAAQHLSKPFAEEFFRFNSTTLRGVREQQPRWQACSVSIDAAMGDALGEVFVRKHFTLEAKRRMAELVDNLRATLREELQRAEWMSPDTKKNAVAKLDAFVAKIGYSDKWRDYSKLAIDRKAYFENVRAAGLHDRLYQLSKIGKMVDRNDWSMTPPTVNAYANFTGNEIVFPAGILQPPLFDSSADDAVNYGAIGAVIGHEMGHHFDDAGSKYDSEGNLRNWWTPEDRKKFEERTACVADQFEKLDVGDGLHHNSKLVLGEALGDLGGLTLAFRAYRRSLVGKTEPPAIDGFTGEQRFFLAFAHVWGGHARPEEKLRRLNVDPHPLDQFRAIGTLQNMPEFHKAFQCKPGDPMVRPPEARCKLW